MIKQVEKAGKTVTGVTTPEGVTLAFGQPGADSVKPNGNGAAASLNDLDRELEEFEARHGQG